jgi:hypothetical protein
MTGKGFLVSLYAQPPASRGQLFPGDGSFVTVDYVMDTSSDSITNGSLGQGMTCAPIPVSEGSSKINFGSYLGYEEFYVDFYAMANGKLNFTKSNL